MKILVVEDNKPDLYLMESLLRGYGHEAVCAADGVEALKKLSEEKVDLILSDILMPRMDGFRLCRRVKSSARWKDIPFIFYSATYTDPKDEVFALSLGADRFIVKPQEPEVFAAMLKEFIGDRVAKVPSATPVELKEEAGYLKQYNERLIKKLEDKMLQLEAASKKLARSENRLRQIIETEPECVKLLAENGNLVEMNPAGLRMIEADSLAQVAGTEFSSLVAPQHRQAFLDLSRRVLAGESGTLEYQVTGLKGTGRWLETHAAPLKDENGKISAVLAITRDVTERKEAQEKLQASQEQLRALAGYLQAAREEERRRIARELHDQIGQILTGVKLSLERAGRDLNRANSNAQALALTNELIGRVRDLSLELRPAMLDDLGLLSALTWHFERYTRQFKIKVAFKHAGLEERRFEPEIETAAYRIVQEALTNVARHARVNTAAVEVRADKDSLRIRVKDLGVGFDPQSLPATASGGLSGMRERAILLGGQLSLESAPDTGTLVNAMLPLRRSAPPA